MIKYNSEILELKANAGRSNAKIPPSGLKRSVSSANSGECWYKSQCRHGLTIAETETSTAGPGIEYRENRRTVD